MSTLKLSEAVRLGAMLGPQARFSLSRQRRKYIFFGPVVNESCALGAAFAASGARTVWHVYQSDGEHDTSFRGGRRKHKAGESYLVTEHPWTELMWVLVSCPACSKVVNAPLFKVIPHLNDKHRMTREQIADWIATIEAEIATPPQPLPQQEEARNG